MKVRMLMSKTKQLIILISLLKSKNSIRSVCFKRIFGKSFICVRSNLGLAFLIFSEDPRRADVESWIYICPLIIYYLLLRWVSISAAKEHNVKILNLIKVWQINACVSFVTCDERREVLSGQTPLLQHPPPGCGGFSEEHPHTCQTVRLHEASGFPAHGRMVLQFPLCPAGCAVAAAHESFLLGRLAFGL